MSIQLHDSRNSANQIKILKSLYEQSIHLGKVVITAPLMLIIVSVLLFYAWERFGSLLRRYSFDDWHELPVECPMFLAIVNIVSTLSVNEADLVCGLSFVAFYN